MDPLLFCKDLLHNLLDDFEHLDCSLPDFAWYGEQCLKASLIDDDLPLLVDCAWLELREALQAICQEERLTWKEALQHKGYDLIWEIADRHTPIWRNILRALYFLYGTELQETLTESGLYTTLPDNYEAISVCLYLEQQLTQRAEAFKPEEKTPSPS